MWFYGEELLEILSKGAIMELEDNVGPNPNKSNRGIVVMVLDYEGL